VKRRSFRLVTVLVSLLACSLVASSSFAFYHVSMGTRQCCKAHCRHAMPTRAAEQCCRAHSGPGPAATENVTPPDTAAPVLALVTSARIAAPLVIVVRTPAHHDPPGGTLLSQHTSLAL
jgi:hypothetical protein